MKNIPIYQPCTAANPAAGRSSAMHKGYYPWYRRHERAEPAEAASPLYIPNIHKLVVYYQFKPLTETSNRLLELKLIQTELIKIFN